MSLQPPKPRYDSKLERLKERIRHKLERRLTGEEERMVELSAALLEEDSLQDEEDSKAA